MRKTHKLRKLRPSDATSACNAILMTYRLPTDCRKKLKMALAANNMNVTQALVSQTGLREVAIRAWITMFRRSIPFLKRAAYMEDPAINDKVRPFMTMSFTLCDKIVINPRVRQFWDSECVASRYFAIHAHNLDPRFFDAKKTIRHSSGAYFSITQATASYDAKGTCDIVLFAANFVSEGMLHDVLVDAGATNFSVETPPKESPRRWLTEKMTSIWDAVAKSGLKYYCTGNQPDAPNTAARRAAESFVIYHTSKLRDTTDSFASKLSCIALDGDMTRPAKDNYMGYPPECQYNAYQLWMQDIWHDECPNEIFQ